MENKGVSGTPWRKERVSSTKQLIGLNSACFSPPLNSSCAMSNKGWTHRFASLFGLWNSLSLFCKELWEKVDTSKSHFPSADGTRGESCIASPPIPWQFTLLKSHSSLARTISSTMHSAGLFFLMHKTNFVSGCPFFLNNHSSMLSSFCANKYSHCSLHRRMLYKHKTTLNQDACMHFVHISQPSIASPSCNSWELFLMIHLFNCILKIQIEKQSQTSCDIVMLKRSHGSTKQTALDCVCTHVLVPGFCLFVTFKCDQELKMRPLLSG